MSHSGDELRCPPMAMKPCESFSAPEPVSPREPKIRPVSDEGCRTAPTDRLRQRHSRRSFRPRPCRSHDPQNGSNFACSTITTCCLHCDIGKALQQSAQSLCADRCSLVEHIENAVSEDPSCVARRSAVLLRPKRQEGDSVSDTPARLPEK